MKRFAPFLLAIAVLGITGCGGNSVTTETKVSKLPPSGLTKRVFITNEFTGRINVLDASTDQASSAAIVLGGDLQLLVPIGTTSTLVYNRGNNTVTLVGNHSEAVSGNSITLPGVTEQILLSADGKTAYAPILATAEVAVLDLTNRVVSAHITGIPGIRRLVMNKAGSKILAFSNDQDFFYVINTADNTKTQVSGLDRPFNGVFSPDDSKAYILNCGAECGGVSAKVTVLDMGTLTAGASVNVGGATVGLSDGTNLYVAGTPTPGNGTLDVISLANLSRTSASSIAISDGLHTLMSLTNGKLYIGARGCTITVTGCLSIYTVAGGAVVLSKPNGQSNVLGDVTAIEPIKDRTVTYVIEAGNLRIYDQKTDQPQAKQIDIAGAVYDVKQVD